MRTIKFRAWDKFDKKWREDFIKLTDGFLEVAHPNVEVSQFTGLLDKNGKEIWEGDIVSYKPSYAAWAEYEGRTVFEVQIDLGARTWLKGEKFGYEGELLIETHECEVIGNMYENPDLLKGR